jgi:hypothetical protein
MIPFDITCHSSHELHFETCNSVAHHKTELGVTNPNSELRLFVCLSSQSNAYVCVTETFGGEISVMNVATLEDREVDGSLTLRK